MNLTKDICEVKSIRRDIKAVLDGQQLTFRGSTAMEALLRRLDRLADELKLAQDEHDTGDVFGPGGLEEVASRGQEE